MELINFLLQGIADLSHVLSDAFVVFRQFGLALGDVFALRVQPSRNTLFLQSGDPEFKVRVVPRSDPQRCELLSKSGLIEIEVSGHHPLVTPHLGDNKGGGMAGHEAPAFVKEVIPAGDDFIQLIVNF